MIDNKKIRGWMIRILHRAYPAGLEADTLFRQLHEMGYEVTRKEFDANVQYLIDDGFVQIQKFGGFSFSIAISLKFFITQSISRRKKNGLWRTSMQMKQ